MDKLKPITNPDDYWLLGNQEKRQYNRQEQAQINVEQFLLHLRKDRTHESPTLVARSTRIRRQVNHHFSMSNNIGRDLRDPQLVTLQTPPYPKHQIPNRFKWPKKWPSMVNIDITIEPDLALLPTGSLSGIDKNTHIITFNINSYFLNPTTNIYECYNTISGKKLQVDIVDLITSAINHEIIHIVVQEMGEDSHFDRLAFQPESYPNPEGI